MRHDLAVLKILQPDGLMVIRLASNTATSSQSLSKEHVDRCTGWRPVWTLLDYRHA